MKLIIWLLIMVGVALSNPTPGPYYSGSNYSVMQTVEFTWHHEIPQGDSGEHSLILYGGPTLVYLWHPDDETRTGMGLEAGAELRKYWNPAYDHLFMSAYGGAGILWRSGEENTRALSGGIKIGWKERFSGSAVSLNLEPYTCVGFMLHEESFSGGFVMPDPVFYLGLKLGFN